MQDVGKVMRRNVSAVLFLVYQVFFPGLAQQTVSDSVIPDVGRFKIFEVSMTTPHRFTNPFAEAQISAKFTSPSGRKVEVHGFYYGDGRWMVRFAPDELGTWSYQAQLIAREETRISGKLHCVPSDRQGFLRISKKNPFRLQYDSGMPFYPIGIQTGGYFRPGMETPDNRWSTVEPARWCDVFAGSINLLRWQLDRGELRLIRPGGPLDQYDTELAARMDELLALQKERGFAHIMNTFEDISLWGNARQVFGEVRDLAEYKSLRARTLPQQEAYLRYIVARFGCFVDVWELFNEDSFAPDDYLAHLARVIRDHDPYNHPITTNYARPVNDWCEIVTWHEYMGMPATQVDAYVAEQIGKFKSYGKPVLNTEFGNQGWLSSYDPVKWRIATWTAFMNESSILFWYSAVKSKGKRPYRGNANAYIGPESRQYFRVLNSFTMDLPVDLRPVAVGYTEHNDVRLYALSNGELSVIYAHHFSDHGSVYQLPDPLFVQTGPGRFRAVWMDPADGQIVKTEEVETRHQYLIFELPSVMIDLACRLERIE